MREFDRGTRGWFLRKVVPGHGGGGTSKRSPYRTDHIEGIIATDSNVLRRDDRHVGCAMACARPADGGLTSTGNLRRIWAGGWPPSHLRSGVVADRPTTVSLFIGAWRVFELDGRFVNPHPQLPSNPPPQIGEEIPTNR